MNIIKELSSHPEAWKEFLEWARKDNTMLLWDALLGSELDEREIRCLLSDLQAYLDSVGIYCDAYNSKEFRDCGEDLMDIDAEYYWKAKIEDSEIFTSHYINNISGYPTRPEALFAAIKKGIEIHNNNLKDASRTQIQSN